jgi:hypothetical protein
VLAAPELEIHQGGSILVGMPVERLAETFEQAIPRRLGADLPPGA